MSGDVRANNKETAIVRFCEHSKIDTASFNRASHVSAFEVDGFHVEPPAGRASKRWRTDVSEWRAIEVAADGGDEEWRAVVGYEGIYDVSSLGRVRNSKGRLMKVFTTEWGYYALNVSRRGSYKTTRIHRLVAMAFVPLIDGKTHVNHKNGNKLDNRAENLEWMTKRENEEHAGRLGRHHAITNPKRGWRLTTAQVLEIRARRAAGELGTDLAKEYGVCRAHLYHVAAGQKRKLG
jgi:hypothetical protein